jgi:hypothetical protein
VQVQVPGGSDCTIPHCTFTSHVDEACFKCLVMESSFAASLTTPLLAPLPVLILTCLSGLCPPG